nr:Gfo/Idh/MocA family oxidoreductase [Hyphomonas sp. Mor2]
MAGLGIGILGAARITEKALIDPAKVIPQVRLAAIAARDHSRAEAYAKRHGVADTLSDYASIVNSDAVELVYNPLPIHLHAEWTVKALAAGKHVLCEKPFAMNVEQARAMIAAAENSGQRLIEAFHYRYHPAFEACLDWIAADEIGEIREVHAAFNVGIKDNGTEIRHRVETGGGAMMDLGCYPLHWALTVMGDAPTDVAATASLTPAGVDERMSADLSFASGASAHLQASMAVGERFRADLKIIGSKGEIGFVNPLAPHQGARLTLSRGPATLSLADISPISTYTYQLAAVVQAIRGDRVLPTEGEMILRQQQALDDIYARAGLRHLRYLQ